MSRARPSRALVVGRFQPFHFGHLHAIRYAMKHAEEIVIGLGSSQIAFTLRNPLTVDERYEMIVRALRAEGLPLGKFYFSPIPDTESPEEDWGRIVLDRVPRVDVAFSNDRETQEDLSRVGIEVRPIPFYRRDLFQATHIREMAAKGDRLWRQLVPRPVAQFLDEVGFEARMRSIAGNRPG